MTPVARPRPRSVTLFGSCVSRDTAEIFDPSRLALDGYVARQSLISAYAAKSRALVGLTVELESAFQRASVTRDLQGALITTLDLAVETDLLVVDLVDERNGIIVLPDGSVATHSLEFANSGLLAHIDNYQHLRLGDPEHLARWEESLALFAEQLERLGITRRCVLLKHDWALMSIEGDRAPFGASKLAPDRMNRLYAPYFAAWARTGLDVLEVPSWLCVTTRSHRWGPAPFHYVEEFYSWVNEQLEARVWAQPSTQ